MTQAEFQEIAPTLPALPGIYRYYDEAGSLLYVGKAKDLRKRVSSYFNKAFTTYKTHELVQRIHHIEFTIVDSEQDAFLLENSLIKQFQPRFNINLKDDKTYPYIVIKNEPGSLAVITGVFGHHGANIVSLDQTNRDGAFHTFNLDVEVHNVQHLMRILAALRATDVVSTAERI